MLIKNFLKYIEYEKRYSINTVLAYKKDLEQFSEYLAEAYGINECSQANYQMIRSWIVRLKENGDTAKTINRKISTLKSFNKFLLKGGEILVNPMSKIVSPKNPKRLPVFIEKVGMDILLDDIKFEEGFKGKRDRMIIELFYMTGIRVSELTNIKDNNIDFSNSTIKVLGKRNKERIIPISSGFRKEISDYLNEKTKLEQTVDSEYLFLNEKGNKLSRVVVYNIVHKYISIISTVEKRSPHVLRHTFATQMLNNGADLNAIKEILGHSSLAATQVYTHNSTEKLKIIYKQAHPKA